LFVFFIDVEGAQVKPG